MKKIFKQIMDNKILMDEYWRIRNEYERKVATDGFAAFENSRKNSIEMPPAFQMTRLQIPVSPKVNEKQAAVLRKADTNAVVMKCPILSVDHVEGTPTMQYWTHTEVNIIAEDEFTLSHIPFLGDAVDDTSFCKDLLKSFPDGIHGTKDGCGQYINDYILYFMIREIQNKHKDIDIKTIFKHVYQQFPNKASKYELQTMYPDLQQRFEPHAITRQEFTNQNGELLANYSSSQLLNSNEVMLCHKCFSYDCIMHSAAMNEGYSGGRRSTKHQGNGKGSKENQRELNKRCSTLCHKIIGGGGVVKNRAGTKRPSLHIDVGCSSSSTSAASSSAQSQWTPHQESVFSVLRKFGEPEYCKIAPLLNMCTRGPKTKKSCQDLNDYACRKGPLSPRLDYHPTPAKKPRKKHDTHRQFRAMKWANSNGNVNNSELFKPCKHKGECSKDNADCDCMQRGSLCTKYCGCPEYCGNRFPGCRCAPGNCRTKQCQCFFASWECDPDLCKTCNCGKLETNGEPICKNVSIQRGLQKKLVVAPSQVAGWGCFANEDIEKNDFISEYCGEVISTEESERRGLVYDRMGCSYLFNLNNHFTVDATRVGNVIRFANHSSFPNCRAHVVVVNGGQRIGIFALRSIKCGEELFFDYAYNKYQQMQFVPKELNPVVKQREKGEKALLALVQEEKMEE